MPMDLRTFALNLLSRSPRVANNPNAQSMIQIIQNGDSEQGELVARNLCQTYGVSQDQAVAQARQFFHI